MVSLTSLYALTLALWLGALSANAVDCGYRTTSRQGAITGPIQRGTYSTEAFQCEWTITVPLLNRIRLEFRENSIPGQSGEHCSKDWILVESSTASGRSTLHGIFCGNIAVGKRIVSVENELRIKYNCLDHSYYKAYSYFTLKYETVPLTPVEVAQYWIENKEMEKENLPRAISSLFLVNEKYFDPGNDKAVNVTNRFRLQLGEDLVRNFTRPMSTGDMSLRVSALLAVCINPRSFYGIDLVHQLRKLVNNETGLPNPYFFLTLCNSGDRMTDHDIKKLTEIIKTHKHELFWLDYQAMALLALVCVREQDDEHNVKNKIASAIAEIKSYQLNDGGFGSLQTTSLVIQALSAAEASETGWNRSSAIKFIDAAKSDGLYGNIHNLYAVAPVISGKTLLYINASKCDFTIDDQTSVNEIRANLTQPIQLVYSVWIGDHVDVTSTVTLKAPNGTKFFDFMRLAADKDEKFKFRSINIKNSPYVYEIGGIINDASSGKYWTLYEGKHMMSLKRFTKGLEHYIPKNSEVAVMWYKTVTVEHSWPGSPEE